MEKFLGMLIVDYVD